MDIKLTGNQEDAPEYNDNGIAQTMEGEEISEESSSPIRRLVEKVNESQYSLFLVALLTIIPGVITVIQFVIPVYTEQVKPCEAYFTVDGNSIPRDLTGMTLESYTREEHAADKPVSVVIPKGVQSEDVDYDVPRWFDPSFTREVMLKNNLDTEQEIVGLRVVTTGVAREQVPYLSIAMKLAKSTWTHNATVVTSASPVTDIGANATPTYRYDSLELWITNMGIADARNLTLHIDVTELAETTEWATANVRHYEKIGELMIDKEVGSVRAINSRIVTLTIGKDFECERGHQLRIKRITASDGAGNVIQVLKNAMEGEFEDFMVDGIEGWVKTIGGTSVINTGGSMSAVGIPIDSGVESQVFEIPVSMTICSGEQLSQALLFFPDLSCHGSMHVEFDVMRPNGEGIFVAKTKEFSFRFGVESDTAQRASLKESEKTLSEWMESSE